jgi:hypothetical protein
MSMLTFVVDCCVLQPVRPHLCCRHCCWRCYGSSSSLSRDATWSVLVHDWKSCALAHNGLRRLSHVHVRLRTMAYDRWKLCALLSMFDDLARARRCLTLLGWLVRLCLTRSKCAWLCCLCRHHTTRWEYVFLRTRPRRRTLVVCCCL